MKYFLPLLFLFIAITACKKDKVSTGSPTPSKAPPACQARPTIYITDSVLVSLKYKAGSFWVLKDSLSETIDTLLVESAESTKSVFSPHYTGCDSSEVYVMTLTLKQEDDEAIKKIFACVFPRGFILFSEYMWNGSRPLVLYRSYPYFATTDEYANYTLRDSTWIGGMQYENVCESSYLEFTTTPKNSNPTRMYENKLKVYFHPSFGVLQLDLRNFISGKLTGRKQVISKNIVLR
jgi:hypothetical protein